MVYFLSISKNSFGINDFKYDIFTQNENKLLFKLQ